MKDNNLKAIEELEGISEVIQNAFMYQDADPHDIYRAGYNNACHTINHFINQIIDELKKEVLL